MKPDENDVVIIGSSQRKKFQRWPLKVQHRIQQRNMKNT